MEVEVVGAPAAPIVSKCEALDCIDKLKHYCEQNKVGSVTVAKLHNLEKDFMQMRLERTTIQ
eukprot:801542-Ditylum_brightwellii.AAC.1